MTLHYTQHQDHNVVTGALELLQQLFRTPPPELLQALTTAGGLAQLPVSRERSGCRSRSGSIVELIGEWLGMATPPADPAETLVTLWSSSQHCARQPTSQTLAACDSGSGHNLQAEELTCREVRWLNEVSSDRLPPHRKVLPGPATSVTLPEIGPSGLPRDLQAPFCPLILVAVHTACSYSAHLLCPVFALLGSLGVGPPTLSLCTAAHAPSGMELPIGHWSRWGALPRSL